MSKKIIFKGNPDGCYLPLEPELLQLDLQESSEEPNKIEQIAKLSVKETKDFGFDSFTESDWIELCLMNSSFLYHPESFLLNDETRQAILLMQYFRKKNIRIGTTCAKQLCELKLPTCDIVTLDVETALPVKITVKKKDIENILKPFHKERKVVFDFLSSGDTQGILPKSFQKEVAELGISNIKELQDFLAIYRPGPMRNFRDYKNNTPCKLGIARDIAAETRGVLLYHDQCALVLQRLTGCTPEESEFFRRDNSGLRKGKSYDELLQRITAHQNVSLDDVWCDYYNPWGYYARYSAPRKHFQKQAFLIYLQALKKSNESK